MTWKETLDKAVKAVKDVAENEKVKSFVANAQQTAINMAKKAKDGALTAADALVHANGCATSMRSSTSCPLRTVSRSPDPTGVLSSLTTAPARGS